MSWVVQHAEGYYWRGWPRVNGSPKVSLDVSDAWHFATYAEALAAANSHHDLANSDQWRVVKRSSGCERTN